MDEKIIIQSEKYPRLFIMLGLIGITLCIPILYFMVCFVIYGGYTMREFLYTDGGAIIPKILAPIFLLASIVFVLAIASTELVVTNKRVYGKAMFGKWVDLPISSICKVETSAFSTIAITIGSDSMKFVMIKNRDEIYSAIDKMIVVRPKTTMVKRDITEHRIRCNVCGHIYCYTDKDLAQNAQNAGLGALSAIGSLASTLGGGTIFHTHHLQSQADRYTDKIVDFKKCPKCNSTNITELTEDEFKKITTASTQASAPTVSNADELKKFKELLDSGIITQEEFDAKKKQLLGL